MSKVVLARVDNRLVHGQIVVFWSKEVNPNRLAIIDEDIANDAEMKQIYKLLAPKEYKMSVIGPEKWVVNEANGKYGDEKVLVLFKNIDGAYKAKKAGLVFDKLQLGNCPSGENKTAFCDYIFLSESDKKQLDELVQLGVEVYAQNTPKDKKISF